VHLIASTYQTTKETINKPWQGKELEKKAAKNDQNFKGSNNLHKLLRFAKK